MVGKKTKALMENPKAKSKNMVRKTLYINGVNYKKFTKLCQDRGHTASSMIDALIEDFIEQFQT